MKFFFLFYFVFALVKVLSDEIYQYLLFFEQHLSMSAQICECFYLNQEVHLQKGKRYVEGHFLTYSSIRTNM